MQALAAAAVLSLAVPLAAHAGEVKEPKTGVAFQEERNGQKLLGVAVRTKTFLKVKVYAGGFYVSQEALDGPLAAYKDKKPGKEFYKELVWGDFDKQIVVEFVRDVGAKKIQNGFRDPLKGADKVRIETFATYFGDTKTGDVWVIRWGKGGVLHVTVKGEEKPPIEDKDFAAAVFGIWLGPKSIQKSVKEGFVSRF